jgi:hypothetical protein
VATIKHILSTLWNAWKKVGQFIGDLIGRLFLMVFYYTIVLPFGVGVRLFGDPLDMSKGKPPAWHEREPVPVSIESSHEQS